MAGTFRAVKLDRQNSCPLGGSDRQQRSKLSLKICIILEGDKTYGKIKQGNEIEWDGAVF